MAKISIKECRGSCEFHAVAMPITTAKGVIFKVKYESISQVGDIYWYLYNQDKRHSSLFCWSKNVLIFRRAPRHQR